MRAWNRQLVPATWSRVEQIGLCLAAEAASDRVGSNRCGDRRRQFQPADAFCQQQGDPNHAHRAVVARARDEAPPVRFVEQAGHHRDVHDPCQTLETVFRPMDRQGLHFVDRIEGGHGRARHASRPDSRPQRIARAPAREIAGNDRRVQLHPQPIGLAHHLQLTHVVHVGIQLGVGRGQQNAKTLPLQLRSRWLEIHSAYEQIDVEELSQSKVRICALCEDRALPGDGFDPDAFETAHDRDQLSRQSQVSDGVSVEANPKVRRDLRRQLAVGTLEGAPCDRQRRMVDCCSKEGRPLGAIHPFERSGTGIGRYGVPRAPQEKLGVWTAHWRTISLIHGPSSPNRADVTAS